MTFGQSLEKRNWIINLEQLPFHQLSIQSGTSRANTWLVFCRWTTSVNLSLACRGKDGNTPARNVLQ